MISWIVKQVSTPVLWAVVGVLVAVLALTAGRLWLTSSALERANADNERLNTLVTQVRAERDSLQSAVEAQNAKIQLMAAEGEAASARASESAAAVERRNAERNREIPDDVQPDQVNSDIRARLQELMP